MLQTHIAGDYTPLTIMERACSSMTAFGSIIYGTETYYRGGDTVAYVAVKAIWGPFEEDVIPF